MPKALVFDTETTGLFDYRKRADEEGQPRMAQIAAALVDSELGTIDEFYLPIKPEGWTMPQELVDKLKHGLTTEYLTEHGVPVADALAKFEAMRAQSDFIVGYGVEFDLKVMRGELRRAGREDGYAEFPVFCVMRAVTKHCALPPTEKMMATGRKTPKTPNLTEAVRIILKREHGGAHDARADMLATIDLLAWCQSQGLVVLKEQVQKLGGKPGPDPAGPRSPSSTPGSGSLPEGF